MPNEPAGSPDGLISLPDGQVRLPDGPIRLSDGPIGLPYGTIGLTDGTIEARWNNRVADGTILGTICPRYALDIPTAIGRKLLFFGGTLLVFGGHY